MYARNITGRNNKMKTMDSFFDLRISVWGEKLENSSRVCKPSEAKYIFSSSRSS